MHVEKLRALVSERPSCLAETAEDDYGQWTLLGRALWQGELDAVCGLLPCSLRLILSQVSLLLRSKADANGICYESKVCTSHLCRTT